MSELNHDLRHNRITGSLAAACLGLDPWRTPMQAWAKIRELQPDREIDYDAEKMSPMDRGHLLEPALVEFGRAALEKRLGDALAMELPATIPHPENEWAASSTDAIYYFGLPLSGMTDASKPTHIAEAKSVAWSDADSREWGDAWTDEVPRHVKVQCQFNMWHWPSTKAAVVPTIIGSGLSMRCYWVPRDDEAIAALAEVLAEWHWQHIIKGKLPPAQAGDLETIVRAFPKPVLIAHEDDPGIAFLVEEDVRLRDLIKFQTGQRDLVRATLGSRLRDYELCEGPWGRVTFRPTKGRKKTDYITAMHTLAMLINAARDSYDSLPPDAPSFEFDEKELEEMIAEALRRNAVDGPPGRSLLTYGAKGE